MTTMSDIMRRRAAEDSLLRLAQERQDALALYTQTDQALWAEVWRHVYDGVLSMGAAANVVGVSHEWVRRKLLPYREEE